MALRFWVKLAKLRGSSFNNRSIKLEYFTSLCISILMRCRQMIKSFHFEGYSFWRRQRERGKFWNHEAAFKHALRNVILYMSPTHLWLIRHCFTATNRTIPIECIPIERLYRLKYCNSHSLSVTNSSVDTAHFEQAKARFAAITLSQKALRFSSPWSWIVGESESERRCNRWKS